MCVQGVCCADGVHCCPAGSTCDSVAGMCRSSANSLAVSWNLLYRRTALMSRLAAQLNSGNQCPDQSLCDDKQTCCELPAAGQYGCCPYEQVGYVLLFSYAASYHIYCSIASNIRLHLLPHRTIGLSADQSDKQSD